MNFLTCFIITLTAITTLTGLKLGHMKKIMDIKNMVLKVRVLHLQECHVAQEDLEKKNISMQVITTAVYHEAYDGV